MRPGDEGGVENAQISEAERVQRAAAGDVAAYESLYREHVGRVHALCLRMVRNGPEAEELVQEIFFRVWQRLGSFRGDSAFGTWVHRVAVNVVIESFRAKRRWQERVDSALDPTDIADTSFARLAGADIDLERAVGRLPPQARLVFVLHDVEGHKHREIAALTGLAVGTSKAHLHRARQLLRSALSDPVGR
jgi:RNA polymerase sigma-70 factor (ECF subfamily)